MQLKNIKNVLEIKQIYLYLFSIMLAIFLSSFISSEYLFEVSINKLLAFMLFVTFLQIPILNPMQLLNNIKFIVILLISNFIIIPLFVFVLFIFIPNNDILKLAFLLVLLMPCVDYVITFSNLANANSKILLISTPILFFVQITLLPLYLKIFLNSDFSDIININHFINSFFYIIIIPFLLAYLFQILGKKYNFFRLAISFLDIFPVISTALVIFVIVLFVFSQIINIVDIIIYTVILYIVFSIFSPIIGYSIGKLFNFSLENKKSLAFSCATRNSLIILPIALSIPNSYPIIPAVIVLQTLIEICFEIFYIKIFKSIKPK